MWLPSHTGLAGNSAANAAAKAAFSLPVSNILVPHSDFKVVINTNIMSCWQHCWDAEQHNKLYQIILKTGLAISYTLPRRDELIIHRLHIGHTHLTHSHLLKKENAPICTVCQLSLTVEHLLIHCTNYAVIRPKCFGSPPTLHELFKKNSTRKNH
jgi:hypothetical protein